MDEEILNCPVCGEKADKVCTGCHYIKYCSIDHQKVHWKVHKSNCRAFAVKKNESLGRFITASRNISEGEIVFHDDPLTFGPKRFTAPVCLGCHAPLAVVKEIHPCSDCGFPMCSLECSQFPIHKENECPLFLNSKIKLNIKDFSQAHPAYECILPIRCLLLYKDSAQWNKLMSMASNNKERMDSNFILWERNKGNVVLLIREKLKMADTFSEDMIHSVIGIIDVNAFEIKHHSPPTEKCGVYPNGGLLCHDCAPNTHSAIEESTNRMIIRTSIAVSKGEQLTTSYVNVLQPTWMRRKHLQATKFFACKCLRCADPTELGSFISGIKCTFCSSGYLFPENSLNQDSEWKCTNNSLKPLNTVTPQQMEMQNHFCQGSVPLCHVNEVLTRAQEIINSLISTEGTSNVQNLENILETLSEKVLHPNHFLLIPIMQKLVKLYGQNDISPRELQRKSVLCDKLLGILDKITPGYTRLRGVLLYEQQRVRYLQCQQLSLNGELNHSHNVETKCENQTLQCVQNRLKIAKDILKLDTLVSSKPTLFSAVEKLSADVANVLTIKRS